MSTWIVLLQGTNVWGQKRMIMPAFQSLLENLGFENVRTYIQSGNAVISSPVRDRQVIGNLIKANISQKIGFETPVFLRSVDDFARIIQENPFLTGRQENPIFLHITFLSNPFTEKDLAGLIPPASTTDEFQSGIEEIYHFCPNGYGRSKLNNTFFKRKLKLRVTTRNWNTIITLHRMAQEI